MSAVIITLLMFATVIFLFFFSLWLMITGAIGFLQAVGNIFRILLGGR